MHYNKETNTIYDSVEKIWKGPPNKSLYNPENGVGALILEILRKTPNKIAQISHDNGLKITCNEMRKKSIQVAEGLRKIGCIQGDVVAIISRNNHDIAPVLFGCLTLGAAVNCLDPTFELDDLVHMLSKTKPKIVFYEAFNYVTVNDAITKLGLESTLYLLGEHKAGCLHIENFYRKLDIDEENYIAPLIENSSEKIAVILCSSGTTGLSKGVCLSHAHLISQCIGHWPSTDDDVIVCFSSLYWISGLLSLITGTVSSCLRVITTESFNADTLCTMVERYNVTTIIAPPSQVSQLLGVPRIETTNFSSVKTFITGGSFVSDHVRIRLQKYLLHGEVIVGYGMTELGGLATLTHPVNHLSTVGSPRSRVWIKIVNENGEAQEYMNSGEICFKYPYNFLGYFGDNEKTKETLDLDGWIHTGDIGFFDFENHLHIVDRLKDIIKYMNYQISPSDIETVLQKETGILDICVVGIEEFDKGTDYPAALIVKPSTCVLTEDDILMISKEHLSDYKYLRGGCYFVESLPMTPSGKVQRKQAKQIANQLYQQHQETNKKKL